MKFNVYQLNTTGASVSTRPTTVHVAGFNNRGDADTFAREKIKELGSAIVVMVIEGELGEVWWGAR